MKKILLVCLGNICRSPLAAGILRKKIKESGKEAIIDSAGFEPYHIGDDADRRAIAVGKKHGVDLSGHVARLFSTKDFDNFDHIYVMDQINFRDVMFVARNVHDKRKVDYILNASQKSKNQPVPDPYGGNDRDFEHAYQLLNEACEKIASSL